MKIGIDIDDTISDTFSSLFPYAQKFTIEVLGRSGRLNTKQAVNHMYVRTMHNWTEEEDHEFLDMYYDTFVKDVKIKPLAREYLEKLAKDNEIYLITARFPGRSADIEKLTLEWLEENKVPFKELIFDAQDKVSIAKKLGLDLFIDDSYTNCKALSENGVKTLIMDSVVNSKFDIDNVTRVYSWPHVYEEYEKILKGE